MTLMRRHHTERHRTDRIGWLRAAAASASHASILTTGVAGLVAEQMMTHDALGPHARDELGITDWRLQASGQDWGSGDSASPWQGIARHAASRPEG